MVVLFGVFVRYEADADARWADSKAQHNTSDLENEFYYRYPSKSRHPAGPRGASRQEPCLAAREQRAGGRWSRRSC